ncbi:ribokinase [Salinispira pacifica]|uniref:Ribokinase n=1 Tax=Salinispira pacifica TaxID=1307761 RepID=V5WIB2_9SPIO|nr:ribokinase [Salinispira pacifica]AHC14911.1 Ribokinase [Salinispira pacifica]
MRILNYGSLNVDHVYSVPHIVRPGETLAGESLNFFAGGKGANQSVAIAKAGGDVWHAGKLGGDADWLLEKLQQFDVKTDYVTQDDGLSGHAIIQVSSQGENSIVLYGGGNQRITKEEIDATLVLFSRGDVLVLQNEINNIPHIMEKGLAQGLKIAVNPAPFTPDVSRWPLDKVHTLVVNETEAAGIVQSDASPGSTLDMLTRRYPETEIVLTLGSKGAWYAKGRKRAFVESRKVNAVDTTAAGDTFLGYYLVERFAGASPERAMDLAAEAAAITVSRPGAMESIPFRSEL